MLFGLGRKRSGAEARFQDATYEAVLASLSIGVHSAAATKNPLFDVLKKVFSNRLLSLRAESFKESSFPLLSSVTALFPCICTKGNKGSDDHSIGN